MTHIYNKRQHEKRERTTVGCCGGAKNNERWYISLYAYQVHKVKLCVLDCGFISNFPFPCYITLCRSGRLSCPGGGGGAVCFVHISM